MIRFWLGQRNRYFCGNDSGTEYGFILEDIGDITNDIIITTKNFESREKFYLTRENCMELRDYLNKILADDILENISECPNDEEKKINS